MRLYKPTFPLCIILLFCAFFSSCSKKSEVINQADVIVSTVNPAGGPYATTVTIAGSGFNINAATNIVKFNGKRAVIQSATSTQLLAIVPKAAGTGPVTVQNGSKTGSGPTFNFISTITVSTLAGNGTWGFADGNATTAQFYYPCAVAVDGKGNVYVADSYNHLIRKITPAGEVSTLAGNGNAGFADGSGTKAQFYFPFGITADANGNVYVADTDNHRIRKITSSGVVSTLAGNGTAGFADGNAATARFYHSQGLAIDHNGNVYVADTYNHLIRKITPAGVVSTLAGNGTAGFADGPGTKAQFHYPYGIDVDVNGNLYVSDPGNNRIRKITPSGVVSTLAGDGTAGYADGNGTAAQFTEPTGVSVDTHGNVYVADGGNSINNIRKITSSGIVSTLAGNSVGFANGPGTTAQFDNPKGIVVDDNGNVYVADPGNGRIRKIAQE